MQFLFFLIDLINLFYLSAKLYDWHVCSLLKDIVLMGRKKVDRSNKIMQTFEATKPLKARLTTLAEKRGMTVSAVIREILEQYFENRN